MASWTDFINDFAISVKRAFETKGLNGVKQCVEENLEEWKSVPLNMAIIGSSGSGKSSFINTVLGLYSDDEGAAKADVVQCTMQERKYPCDKCPNVNFWDLPGVGTTEFPRETYLEVIEFDRYDFFIIITAERFTENDVWFAKTIQEKNKQYYFVRSKIDADIASTNLSLRHPINENSIVDKIRNECTEGLKQQNLPNDKVFLIANYAKEKFDFGVLFDTLLIEAPAIKRDAMAMTFSVFTEKFIRAKEQTLRKRISKVAILSAVGSAIPLPGIGIVIDAVSIVEEAVCYRSSLGLNDERLQRIADRFQVPLNDLKSSLDLKSTAIVLTASGIAAFCQFVVVSEAVENVSKFAIPVLGSFIAGAASFWSTGKCLERLLDLMVEDSLKVNKKLKELLEHSSY